jgi:preprotein translocase subunit YajC
MWRPQAKRQKEHKNLIGGLAKGDEVITAGGIIGKVVRLTDDYVALEVADGVEMKFQKSHVAAELPKGTIKGI